MSCLDSQLLKNILANAEDDKHVPIDEAGCSYKTWRSEQKRKAETIPKGKPKGKLKRAKVRYKVCMHANIYFVYKEHRHFHLIRGLNGHGNF